MATSKESGKVWLSSVKELRRNAAVIPNLLVINGMTYMSTFMSVTEFTTLPMGQLCYRRISTRSPRLIKRPVLKSHHLHFTFYNSKHPSYSHSTLSKLTLKILGTTLLAFPSFPTVITTSSLATLPHYVLSIFAHV